MDVKIMRVELMRFSKEELVTELLAALVELAFRKTPQNNGDSFTGFAKSGRLDGTATGD